MRAFEPKVMNNEEKRIQNEIEFFLKIRSWHIMRTHGNMYQSGFPDNFICHKHHGYRWLEIKLPDMKGSRFTKAQLDNFPKLCDNGSGVWVMTAATDHEYMKLFQTNAKGILIPNWYQYLKV